MPLTEEEQAALESKALDQGFPLYYSLSAAFLDSEGDPSGAVGARAELVRELNNFPHIFYGVRIRNVYALPDVDLAAAFAAARLVDNDQVVEIQLAQQNITAQALLQDELVGGHAGVSGGVHWHPFPHPYLMAGGNNVRLVVTRLNGYPDLDEDNPVLPVCRAALVTAVFRKGFRTVAPPGVFPPEGSRG